MTVTQADKLQGLSEQEFSQWLSALCDPNTPFKGVDKLRLLEGREKDGSREIIEVDSFGKRVLQVRFRRSDTESVSQILYFRDVTHENVVDQMKSEFLSTAAHELRTPMASIYGFTELLLHQEHDRETEKEFLGIVYRQSELMVRIIDELLDLARIEARKGKDFVLSDVDMQDLLSDLARTYVPPSGRAVPHLEMPSASLRVRADAGKLRQALLNVLVNAYKFSAAGGEVEITLESIMDQGSQEVSSVAVVISDTGIGMTPEQLQQVCNRFYRADSSGKVSGTGLGMAIVKEIVELHHGEIHIASQWGKGTQVRLTFPVISDGR